MQWARHGRYWIRADILGQTKIKTVVIIYMTMFYTRVSIQCQVETYAQSMQRAGKLVSYQVVSGGCFGPEWPFHARSRASQGSQY